MFTHQIKSRDQNPNSGLADSQAHTPILHSRILSDPPFSVPLNLLSPLSLETAAEGQRLGLHLGVWWRWTARPTWIPPSYTNSPQHVQPVWLTSLRWTFLSNCEAFSTQPGLQQGRGAEVKWEHSRQDSTSCLQLLPSNSRKCLQWEPSCPFQMRITACPFT